MLNIMSEEENLEKLNEGFELRFVCARILVKGENAKCGGRIG
jgi:hypothetical protein